MHKHNIPYDYELVFCFECDVYKFKYCDAPNLKRTNISCSALFYEAYKATAM